MNLKSYFRLFPGIVFLAMLFFLFQVTGNAQGQGGGGETGHAKFWTKTGNTPSADEFIGTTGEQPLRVLTNDSLRVIITPNGLVGINLEQPATTLDVNGKVTGSAYRIRDIVGENAVLVIDSLGNIGISDGNTIYKIGNLKVTGQLMVGEQVMFLETRENNGDIYVEDTLYLQGKGDGAHTVINNKSGNVAIGTTNTGHKLNLAGDFNIKNGTIMFDGEPLGVWQTNNGNVYVEDSVGIGTTNPESRLHVDGQVTASDFKANNLAGENALLLVDSTGKIGTSATLDNNTIYVVDKIKARQQLIVGESSIVIGGVSQPDANDIYAGFDGDEDMTIKAQTLTIDGDVQIKNGSLLTDVGKGTGKLLDYTGLATGDNKPSGWYSHPGAAYSREAADGAMKVTANTTSKYADLYYHFSDPVNLSSHPYLTIKIKTDTPEKLRMLLKDANGKVNGYDPVDQLVTDSYTELFYDFNGHLNYDKYNKIDIGSIQGISLKFNPGATYSGVFYIEKLAVGDQSNVPERATGYSEDFTAGMQSHWHQCANTSYTFDVVDNKLMVDAQKTSDKYCEIRSNSFGTLDLRGNPKFAISIKAEPAATFNFQLNVSAAANFTLNADQTLRQYNIDLSQHVTGGNINNLMNINFIKFTPATGQEYTGTITIDYVKYGDAVTTPDWQYNASNDAMYYNNNVGINTNNPASALDVKGKIRTNALKIDNLEGKPGFLVVDSSGNAYSTASAEGGNQTTVYSVSNMRVTNELKVGDSSLILKSSSGTEEYENEIEVTGGDLTINTGDNNLKINSSSLDVQGDVAVSGNIYKDGVDITQQMADISYIPKSNGENLAAGKVDNNIITGTVEGSERVHKINLGEEYKLSSVKIKWSESEYDTENNKPVFFAPDFNIDISKDGATWKETSYSGSNSPYDEVKQYDLNSPTNGQYIRLRYLYYYYNVPGVAKFQDMEAYEYIPKMTLYDLKVLNKLGIGTDNLGEYRLAVDGKIRAERVKVYNSADWEAPDYVFDEDYELKSLEEVEQYIKQNKHLPGIPAGKIQKADGVDLGEMSTNLLEKIEELTLYIIEQEKKLKQQQKKIEEFRQLKEEIKMIKEQLK